MGWINSRRIVAGVIGIAAAVAGVLALSGAPVWAQSSGLPLPAAASAGSIPGMLDGVAAASADNVWAVGQTGLGKTLILHWNGRTWAPEATARMVPGELTAIAVISADNAWAVGSY